MARSTLVWQHLFQTDSEIFTVNIFVLYSETMWYKHSSLVQTLLKLLFLERLSVNLVKSSLAFVGANYERQRHCIQKENLMQIPYRCPARYGICIKFHMADIPVARWVYYTTPDIVRTNLLFKKRPMTNSGLLKSVFNALTR